MPILEVLGLKGGLDQRMVLMRMLKQAVASVKELDVDPGQVTPYIHQTDQERTNQVIVVKVTGLFKKPKRTSAVREKLVREIYRAVWQFLKDYKFISTEFVEVVIGDKVEPDSGDYYAADPRSWDPDKISGP